MFVFLSCMYVCCRYSAKTKVFVLFFANIKQMQNAIPCRTNCRCVSLAPIQSRLVTKAMSNSCKYIVYIWHIWYVQLHTAAADSHTIRTYNMCIFMNIYIQFSLCVFIAHCLYVSNFGGMRSTPASFVCNTIFHIYSVQTRSDTKYDIAAVRCYAKLELRMKWRIPNMSIFGTRHIEITHSVSRVCIRCCEAGGRGGGGGTACKGSRIKQTKYAYI